MDALIPIICLLLAVFLGIRLALYNLKVLESTKQERLEARSAYKKEKNAKLKKFFNL